MCCGSFCDERIQKDLDDLYDGNKKHKRLIVHHEIWLGGAGHCFN